MGGSQTPQELRPPELPHSSRGLGSEAGMMGWLSLLSPSCSALLSVPRTRMVSGRRQPGRPPFPGPGEGRRGPDIEK